jgi:hypothetical protein
MNAVIDVSRDFEGLRLAAGEFFEEEFVASGLRRSIEQSADDPNLENAERLLRDLAVRTIAGGYFERLKYLLWLEGTLEFGEAAGLAPLLLDELEGLKVLRLARSEFLQQHPQCRHCGELNVAHSKCCRSCRKEVRG